MSGDGGAIRGAMDGDGGAIRDVTGAEDADLECLRRDLEQRLAGLDGALVAFSGGVDSSLVAALAAQALGQRALAVTAVSPALAHGELDGARRVAAAVGIRHEVIETDELAREGYRRNDRHRCFHCKTELYGRLVAIAAERGFAAVLSGANADDRADWRPGLRAAADHGVIHPLLEVGVGKSKVRQLAARLAVPSARKPASPCLASRIPYGTRVDPEKLARIDRAERGVRALGYGVLRVRHHGDLGRVELGATELERALAPQAHDAICSAVLAAGYGSAVIDPQPFRSGSLNDVHSAARTRRVIDRTD